MCPYKTNLVSFWKKSNKKRGGNAAQGKSKEKFMMMSSVRRQLSPGKRENHVTAIFGCLLVNNSPSGCCSFNRDFSFCIYVAALQCFESGNVCPKFYWFLYKKI